MAQPPTWTEPTLFSEVGLDYPALTVELVVHIEGPSGRVQAVASVRDPRVTGYLSIIGHHAAPLDTAQHYACAILIEAIEEAVRHVTPF